MKTYIMDTAADKRRAEETAKIFRDAQEVRRMFTPKISTPVVISRSPQETRPEEKEDTRYLGKIPSNKIPATIYNLPALYSC